MAEPNAPPGETPNEQKPLTAADVAEIVNKAITGHLKRLPDTNKLVADALAARDAKAAEELAAREAEKGASGDKGKQVDPEVLALKRQLDDQAKRIAKAEAERDTERTRARNERAAGELQAALAKHVRPEAVPALVKAFRSDLTFDDQGNPSLPVEDGATTIAAAVESWAKDKANAWALPAPTQGGAGSPRSNGNPGAPSFSSLQGKDPANYTDAERATAFTAIAQKLSTNA